MAAYKQTCVRVRNGRLDGQVFPIGNGGVTLVGRAPLNHIILPHPDVSSIHCILAPDRKAHGLLLIDVRTRAGTLVGGDPVAKHVLHIGDVVSIGPFELELTDVAASHPLAGPQHIGSNGHPVFQLAPRRSRGNDGPFATGLVTVIGRSRLADLRVRDPLASRFHCLIALDTTEEGVLPFVIDLRSHGRTYVNDHAVHRKHLRPGDVLTVGLTEFELREPPAQAEEPCQETPEAPSGVPFSDSTERVPREPAVESERATPFAPEKEPIYLGAASAQEKSGQAEPEAPSGPATLPVPEEGAAGSQGDEPPLLLPGADDAEAPLHAPTPVAREEGLQDSPKLHGPTAAPDEPDETGSSVPLAAEGVDEDVHALPASEDVQAWPSEMSDVDEVDVPVPAGEAATNDVPSTTLELPELEEEATTTDRAAPWDETAPESQAPSEPVEAEERARSETTSSAARPAPQEPVGEPGTDEPSDMPSQQTPALLSEHMPEEDNDELPALGLGQLAAAPGTADEEGAESPTSAPTAASPERREDLLAHHAVGPLVVDEPCVEDGVEGLVSEAPSAEEDASTRQEQWEPAAASELPDGPETVPPESVTELGMELAPTKGRESPRADGACEIPSQRIASDPPAPEVVEQRWDGFAPEADEPAVDLVPAVGQNPEHPPVLAPASIDYVSSQQEEATLPSADVASAETGPPFPDTAVEDAMGGGAEVPDEQPMTEQAPEEPSPQTASQPEPQGVEEERSESSLRETDEPSAALDSSPGEKTAVLPAQLPEPMDEPLRQQEALAPTATDALLEGPRPAAVPPPLGLAPREDPPALEGEAPERQRASSNAPQDESTAPAQPGEPKEAEAASTAEASGSVSTDAWEDVDDPDPVGVDIGPVEQPQSIPPLAESGAESRHIDVQAQGRSVLLPTTAPRRPIRRRLVGRVLGLAVCLAGSAASIALACFLVRPQYQASATIEIKPVVTVRAEGGERHEAFAAYFDTQMAKVRSDAVLCRALDEAPTAHVVQGRARGEALGALRDTLQVQRLGASYLFAVRLSAQTPQGLADTVNAIARACEAEAQEDQRRATSRQRQRLENERKRLQGEVDGKTAALARLRELLSSMSTSGVEGSGRETITAVEQALIDIQAKQASLRTRLDERRATLKARRAENRTAEIEKVLAGDAEVRRLTTLRDSVAQKLQSAQVESVAPEPADLEKQVSQDPRVTALRQELGREQRLLDRMLEAATRGGGTSEPDDSPTIPCGLIAAALADHPEVQRLASLRDELSQALKRELDADQADRRPPAMKGRSTLRADSLRSHLLTIQCQLQEYGSQALEATRTAIAALPARLAQEQSRAREQILARLRKTADGRTAALRGQLHSLDKQIDQRREELRPIVAARTESAALEPILADIRTLEAEVVACDASEGVFRGLLAKHSSRRATAEQASWEARDLENGLGQAREALARTERDLLDLDVMAVAPGVVTIASQAIEPTGPEPYVARRASYSAAGIVLACLLAAMTSRLVTRRHD